jgi:DNA-binding protein H-NS
MEILHSDCAGLDIHKDSVVACVRQPRNGTAVASVKTFKTTTLQLMQMSDWLSAEGCTHIEMEATGVYWKSAAGQRGPCEERAGPQDGRQGRGLAPRQPEGFFRNPSVIGMNQQRYLNSTPPLTRHRGTSHCGEPGRSGGALQVALLLLLFGTAVPLRAQTPPSALYLYVCNNGTVPVEVVTAQRNDPFLGVGKLYYDIHGKSIAPGKCGYAYGSTNALPAYIGFGFVDAKGQWGSGTIAQVPDFGTFARWFQTQKILVAAAQAMCVRSDETDYRSDGDIPTDCASLKLTGGPDVGHGPLLPLTSALFLDIGGLKCSNGVVGGNSCDYYLNISPSASDRDLHARRGASSGTDIAETGNSGITQFLQALAKAAAEERQREAKAAADAAEAQQRHLSEQAIARVEYQKQILAADAAGNRDAKIPAQIIRREEDDNRQRWGGTRRSPAAYDSQWIGQNVAIVGTVSRVVVDPKGSPQWVSIYFKESPDATFVVCSPYADLFQERVGRNLSALVGKTLEAAGQVESPHCGDKVAKGSIRVVESNQWQVH